MEELCTRGDIDALVFHAAGVATAGCVYGKCIEFRLRSISIVLQGCESEFIDRDERFAFGLFFDKRGCCIRADAEGLFSERTACVGFVAGTVDTFDLFFAFFPGFVDARSGAIPNNVVFLFHEACGLKCIRLFNVEYEVLVCGRV